MKPIRIDPQSPVPIYRQIRDQIRSLILAGVIEPGEPVPSARALGSQLGVNMLTVNKAYQELKAEGLLQTRRGEGLYVLSNNDEGQVQSLQTEDVKQRLLELLSIARAYGIEDQEFLKIATQCVQGGK